MLMRVIGLLAMLLSGCATTGTLDYGVMVDLDLVACNQGEPYYVLIGVVTYYDTMTQTVQLSWQCPENDGARKYLILSNYSLMGNDDGTSMSRRGL